ncbi:hypothetical protein EC504_02865 [Helicobacter pylori]|nr:hypothetical protein EC504_02865 [Helicobacter pylori]
MCFENACRLVAHQNGDFLLEIEQNQQNQKKKKKDFHGINIKFLLSFFCFYYLILAFLLA